MMGELGGPRYVHHHYYAKDLFLIHKFSVLVHSDRKSVV